MTPFFFVTVTAARNDANVEAAVTQSELPSYTIASGLPSYEEALEQLKKVKNPTNTIKTLQTNDWTPHTPPTPTEHMATLSVVHLFPCIDSKEDAKTTS